MVKNLPSNAGDIKRHGFDPWVRKTPGVGNGNSLQYYCLENPKDRGAWQATVHGDAKSWTQLKQLSMHTIHWIRLTTNSSDKMESLKLFI